MKKLMKYYVFFVAFVSIANGVAVAQIHPREVLGLLTVIILVAGILLGVVMKSYLKELINHQLMNLEMCDDMIEVLKEQIESAKASKFEEAAKKTAEINAVSEVTEFDDARLAEIEQRNREEKAAANLGIAESLIDSRTNAE